MIRQLTASGFLGFQRWATPGFAFYDMGILQPRLGITTLYIYILPARYISAPNENNIN